MIFPGHAASQVGVASFNTLLAGLAVALGALPLLLDNHTKSFFKRVRPSPQTLALRSFLVTRPFLASVLTLVTPRSFMASAICSTYFPCT